MLRELNGLVELTEAPAGRFANEDMAPVPISGRTWGRWDIAALWVGMSVCIPTYMLASGLISKGMNWWQAILTVFLGNLIVLIPMVLNAHAGTRYGIPFPVFARAAFGLSGTHVPGLLRAVVACGWFGIQTWIGGAATHQILAAMFDGWRNMPVLDLGPIGAQPLGAWLGFLIFWVVNTWVIIRGIETIRWLERLAAPFLIIVGVALLIWALVRAKGFGPMLQAPSKFTTAGEFLAVFIPGLTGMVGYWATLSLNIPDFTRYARSQREQVIGQAIGLNTTMPFYSFIGVAVTASTVVIFGEEIWNPVELMARFESPIVVIIAMAALWMATLSTNLAANVIAPANSFSNLWPKRISFKVGGIITAVIGVLILPWKLLEDPDQYIFTWLVGYSALLGPIGGVMIADYFLLRRTKLKLAELYREGGAYWYRKGTNPAAMIALAVAVLVNLPGFLVEIKLVTGESGLWAFFHQLYFYAWFVGFFIAFGLYLALMKRPAEDSG